MSCSIIGRVTDSGGTNGPIVGARVELYNQAQGSGTSIPQYTDEHGKFEFPNLVEGETYTVQCSAFGLPAASKTVTVRREEKDWVTLSLPVNLTVTLKALGAGETAEQCSHAIAGKRFLISAESSVQAAKQYEFFASPDGAVFQSPNQPDAEVIYAESGSKIFGAKLYDPTAGAPAPASGSKNPTYVIATHPSYASEGDRHMIGGHIGVRLERTRVHPTRDQALWIAIRNRTHAISFGRYNSFINRVLQTEERERLDDPVLERKLKELGTNLHGVGAYEVLKIATEAFLLLDCGIRIEEDRDPNRRFYNKEFVSASVGETMYFDVARATLR